MRGRAQGSRQNADDFSAHEDRRVEIDEDFLRKIGIVVHPDTGSALDATLVIFFVGVVGLDSVDCLAQTIPSIGKNEVNEIEWSPFLRKIQNFFRVFNQIFKVNDIISVFRDVHSLPKKKRGELHAVL